MSISKEEVNEIKSELYEISDNVKRLEKLRELLREKSSSLKFSPEEYMKAIEDIAGFLIVCAGDSSEEVLRFNPDTLEVEAVMDEEKMEDEYDEDEIEEYNEMLASNNWSRYVEFYPLDFSEIEPMMADFVTSLPDDNEKVKLETAACKRKPYSSFSAAIHNSKYREKWFAFRDTAAQSYLIIHFLDKILDVPEGADE